MHSVLDSCVYLIRLELDFEWITEGPMEVNRLIIYMCYNVVISIVFWLGFFGNRQSSSRCTVPHSCGDTLA
jgi:hypothetical protein